MIKKGQYLSVSVYSASDNSYYIRTETGFSCHSFSTKYGFHADKNGNQGFGRSWREVTNFRTSGTYALYTIGGGFNTGQGRYYAPQQGVYFCNVILRLDGASAAGYFRINMVVNNGLDLNNGFHGIRGNRGSTHYGTIGVAGSIYLQTGNRISTYLYASSDNSFTVQSESGFGCHLMGTRIGFHADASGDQVFGRGWARLARWRTSGNNELYALGGGLTSSIWYVAPSGGFYMCAAQLRVDSASNTRFRMIIAINNGMDTHNGLHVSDGNQGSTNYRTMRILGTIYLKKSDRTSVHIYSASDNSWRLQHESGFRCHKFGGGAAKVASTSGFNADLAASIHAGRGWREITNWRTSGNNELYESMGEFNNGNGRFYPKATGYYLCNSNAVLDGFTSAGYSRLMLVVNNHRDVNNGLMAIESNGGSSNWRGMTVGGTVLIKKGQYLSLQTYSSNDNSYYIRTETGFSCHAFSTKYGFHADKNGNQGFGRSWREVTNFRTGGTYALYNIGGGFNAGQGRYYAPSTGYYFCSNLLRLDSASAAGYFRINMVLNRGADVNNGFHGIRGNKGSTYYGTLGVADSVRLSKGWTMSTYLYSSSDNSFTVQSESGFGCHQMAGGVGFHADGYGDQVFGRGWARLARWRNTGNNELYSA